MNALRHGLGLLLLLVICATVAPAADYQVGNLNPPTGIWGVDGVVAGPVPFAYLIYPPDQAQCSQQGFTVEAIHMMLDFPDVWQGQTVQVVAALYTAEIDPTDGFLKPGFPLCESMIMDYSTLNTGTQTISVPLGPCVPVLLDDHYFLVLRIEDPFEANLPIDDQPQPGIVYYDKGDGWQDMFLGVAIKTPAGKSIIWGDITCAVPPIGIDDGAWGQIKGMYR